MAIQLNPGEYRSRQYGSGRNSSGPSGRRKTRPYTQYRKALAARGKAYWAGVGKSVHGVTYAVRCVYWT